MHYITRKASRRSAKKKVGEMTKRIGGFFGLIVIAIGFVEAARAKFAKPVD